VSSTRENRITTATVVNCRNGCILSGDVRFVASENLNSSIVSSPHHYRLNSGSRTRLHPSPPDAHQILFFEKTLVFSSGSPIHALGSELALGSDYGSGIEMLTGGIKRDRDVVRAKTR
jgi:hypothetical protein